MAFERRAELLNHERLARLEAVRRAALPADPSLETIIEAFTQPLLERAARGGAGWKSYFALVRPRGDIAARQAPGAARPAAPMKYRHGFHAGNFADVHKHIALLGLLRALKRKDKGFLYLDSHAGRGCYDLSSPNAEAAAGIGRLLAAPREAQELRDYAGLVAQLRADGPRRYAYPGSPLIALAELRPQDRAVLCELEGSEAHALQTMIDALPQSPQARVRAVRGDGLAELRALLPPPERRGLVFLDPPYEASDEPAQLLAALAQGLRRFSSGVFAAWYPIKEARDSAAWLARCARTLTAPLLVSELWLFPRDSRVALNGSGLLIANAPWQTLERMRVWLPQLQAALGGEAGAGNSARMLSESAP